MPAAAVRPPAQTPSAGPHDKISEIPAVSTSASESSSRLRWHGRPLQYSAAQEALRLLLPSCARISRHGRSSGYSRGRLQPRREQSLADKQISPDCPPARSDE